MSRSPERPIGDPPASADPTPEGDGDEGPVSPSWGAWPAAVLGLVGALGLGVATGTTGVALLATASATTLSVAVVLSTDGDPLRVAAGTTLGLAAMGGLAVATATGPTATTLALSAAAFGAASAPLGAVGEGRFVRGLGMFTYALVPLGTAAVASALWPAVAFLGVASAILVREGTAATAVFTGSLLAAFAAAALRSGVRALPAVELAPRGRRERVRDVVEAAESTLTLGLRYALAGVAAGLVVLVLAGLGVVPDSLLGALGAVAGVEPVRWLLFATGVLGVVVSVSTRSVRLTGATLLERARRGAAVGTGTVLTLVVAVAATPLLSAAARAGPTWVEELLSAVVSVFGVVPAALLSASVLLLSAVFATVLLPGAVGMGIAPDRALGPALAAAGLLCGAALSAGTASPLAVFGAVAAGMVVWDLGEYAVGVGEEVGPAAGRTPEAVHALGSLTAGLAGVVLAVGLHSLVAGGTATGPLALAGLAAAFVGVLVLVALLRG
ncbi:hypothetical protein BRD00_10295 [Halobacteriales archaeon QS_8_69_26]|nr:MAG: hypothetical protein BRD00_10295 [Halobacteriales archaeon QS_8_69_26]